MERDGLQPAPRPGSYSTKAIQAEGEPTADGLDGGASQDGDWAGLLQPPLNPGELGWLGNYGLLRVLGAGGMGVVFEAEDAHLRRPVALKVMRRNLLDNPAARERFLREARAAAAVRDERIVTIYQVGQADDVPFLAMELLAGESLDARLRREGRLPAEEILRLGREVAEGLAVAHDHGLVHRDIKPANLWLEQRGQKPGSSSPAFPGRIKILDFGLARPAEEGPGLTAPGQVLGTPHFMAPEQARGGPVDHRADLFSLGCVLYRMAAGTPPFPGEDVMAVLTALAVDTPRPLGEVRPELPPALCSLVERLLAKRPDDRPASAWEVAGALRDIEQGRQTPAAPLAPPARPVPARWGPRRLAVVAAAAALLLAAGGLGIRSLGSRPAEGGGEGRGTDGSVPAVAEGEPIRVGILHSTSGTLAESGSAVVDATLLAVEEINHGGGLLGRRVEPVFRDGRSDPLVYAREAERLIAGEKVSVLFGCWTSAARKEVKPVVERHDHLLFYPVQYEGLEQSPNIVYGGATPNQQIVPAVRHCFTALHKRRFFLVGSDYVFPRVAQALVREEVEALGGQVVGEEYLPLGSMHADGLVRKILETRPDVILNTVNGDSNKAFFRELRSAGVTPGDIPTVSFSIAEQELRGLADRDTVGDYAAWTYFQSLDRPANREFVRRFRSRFGPQRVTSDPLEAAYAGVHLWAEAVRAAGSEDVRAVREALRGRRHDAPGGPMRIDAETLHTWKPFRFGRIVEDDQFEIVWSNDNPQRPEPFPASRPRAGWEQLLDGLYQAWGGRWANPGLR